MMACLGEYILEGTVSFQLQRERSNRASSSVWFFPANWDLLYISKLEIHETHYRGCVWVWVVGCVGAGRQPLSLIQFQTRRSL